MESNFLSFCSSFFIKKTYKPALLAAGLTLMMSPSFGSNRYLLCGPDEDGCDVGNYQDCFCIPYNDLQAKEAYCLDFDRFTCTPVSQTPDCDPSFIFHDQAECLATIFQSGPIPPCSVTTKDFCLEHRSRMCNPDGELNSCH